MTATLMLTRVDPFVMRYHPMPEPMTDEEFLEFCRMNPDWRIERSAEGELILMPPAGGEIGIVSGDPVLAGFVLDLARIW